MIKKIIFLFAFALLALSAGAQKVVLKNNLVYDALLTPNLGVEVGLGKRTTIDISGNYNPFKLGEKEWKHWLVQPEFRYWFCERFNGHFLGGHVLGGEFNVANTKLPFGLLDATNLRYDGWYAGVGVSYGYQWMLAKRWSIEATVGVGYARFSYDKYLCAECSPVIDSGKKNYFGPTKLGVTLIFVIK